MCRPHTGKHRRSERRCALNANIQEAKRQSQTFHAFDSRTAARRFRDLTGNDNILENAIGWQLGKSLPQNAIVYLWSNRDEIGNKWVAEVAATSKAKLKKPIITEGFCRVGEWLRLWVENGDIEKAMAGAETIENTNEKTDRDSIIEAFKRADATSEADYQEALRQNEVNVFESRTKYHDDSKLLDVLPDLPRLDYEHLREHAAKRLGCRPPVLDRLIEERRVPKQGVEPKKQAEAKQQAKDDGRLQGAAVLCPDVEPWPEPIDGAAVLNEIAERITSYVVLPDGAAHVIALWCAHSHCFHSFGCSPRLNITSPERGCGKTTLRDVVALFVSRPLCLENMTSAVAFRLAEQYAPVIIADECDAWLRDNEELRGLLNAAHRKGGVVVRCEGDNNEPRLFRVYTPAVLCGIGTLPGTLHDRSIVVKLERAKAGELSARFDSRRTDKEKELCRKLARFCADNRERLQAIDPQLPDDVFNRLADNWRPLFAIAEVAGGDWPKYCAEALSKLTAKIDTVETLRVQLLADIRKIVSGKDESPIIEKVANTEGEIEEWLPSGDLCDRLIAMTERAWGEANKGGKPINERWLAIRLGDFDIKPGRFTDASGHRGRGYKVTAFREAFERYLKPEPDSTRDGGVME
jgi:putative DNA primase/helicase